MTKMQEFISEQMISVDNRLPHEDQEVIAWNGKKLVAAKFRHQLTFIGDNPVVDLTKVQTELRPTFAVQKYPSIGDRSLSVNWTGITHWMPAQ
jgi:hypothetical protein